MLLPGGGIGRATSQNSMSNDLVTNTTTEKITISSHTMPCLHNDHIIAPHNKNAINNTTTTTNQNQNTNINANNDFTITPKFLYFGHFHRELPFYGDDELNFSIRYHNNSSFDIQSYGGILDHNTEKLYNINAGGGITNIKKSTSKSLNDGTKLSKVLLPKIQVINSNTDDIIAYGN